MISIKINGKKVNTESCNKILDVAKENGIEIPTLCHDKELSPYGSCWVCAVKVKDRKGFVTACGTQVIDGMEIETDSIEVHKARKMALELLLSDHYADCEAPCKIACPNQVDVQSYISFIANGQHREAVKVIKETLPMPLSIGRVCPAFCEEECRRSIVEEPVSIRQLKRHAADFDIFNKTPYIPKKDADNGKKVVIVGAGPSGLTCGYYLSNKGYEVTVLESAPKAGGWLRYGIPEYRLPKRILDKEIKLMCKNGMKIKYKTELGKDITLSELNENYDAVFLAIGAQNAVPMRVKGSKLEGCFLGVDFLRDLTLGKKIKLEKKVAVIGGGNTAIDCARTAARMDVNVTLVYRRTRQEMPAEAYEVDAAEEEGIKFHFLTNPVENTAKRGKLKSIKMEKMKLGEPDDSGRRRPEPTGEFFKEEYGSVIAAISQKPEIDFVAKKENQIKGKELPLTRWDTVIADEETQFTGLGNIFAGGDFRRGPATAIEAIADGRKAAEAIDRLLNNQPLIGSIKLFDSKKEKKLKDVDPKEFEQYEEIPRFKMPELEPRLRASNFKEVETGFEEEDARAEAERCLECGCQVNETCDLRRFATDYKIEVDLFMGDKNKHPIDDSHPFIRRDANKCINCGRCVRICTEVQGPGVLGYIYRGFTTYVAPEFGESLSKTNCEICGKCIEVCPVGALLPKNSYIKLNPHLSEKTIQNCGLCGTGCNIEVSVQDNRVTIVEPADGETFNQRDLCFDGKFGWQIFEDEERIKHPYQRNNDLWIPIKNIDKAANIIEDKLQTAETKMIYISPTSSIEETLLMQHIAKKIGSEISSLSIYDSFVDNLFDTNLYTKTYDDLEQAEYIVIVGKISKVYKTIARRLQRKGAKLILITNETGDFNDFADELHNDEPFVKILEKILQYNIEQVKDEMDDFDDDEQHVEPLKLDLPEKTVFIYNRDLISEESIWNIWAISSLVCNFEKGSGIFPTSKFNNLRGLQKLGINAGEPGNHNFVLFYGELPCEEQKKRIKNSNFIVSVNTHIDDADSSHLLLPKASYLEMESTSIADDGRISSFKNPKKSTIHNQLLRIFKKAGLLTAQEAKISFWNIKAKALLEEKVKARTLSNQELIDYLYTIENMHFDEPKQASVQKKRITKLKKMAK
ncbi:MAG: FAD-dependent oxidoreductase [Candidatus Cloacimonetes bacterium]|jgi:formate dehydrogenase major subunit|nr:FAD-dependent oxidoreductase [Candidatus Cloacimonadota bacterium]